MDDWVHARYAQIEQAGVYISVGRSATSASLHATARELAHGASRAVARMLVHTYRHLSAYCALLLIGAYSGRQVQTMLAVDSHRPRSRAAMRVRELRDWAWSQTHSSDVESLDTGSMP
jgi:hypothetical protein